MQPHCGSLWSFLLQALSPKGIMLMCVLSVQWLNRYQFDLSQLVFFSEKYSRLLEKSQLIHFRIPAEPFLKLLSGIIFLCVSDMLFKARFQ